MRVKLIANDKHYAELKRELVSLGIEIDDTSNLILQEANAWLDHLICRRGDELHRVDTKDIIYIESLSRDIFVHTLQGEYKAGERLWQLNIQLNPKKFLRISNSVIVSTEQIKSIKPALSQKFLLTMTDGSKVDVTRTYYHSFREAMNI